jgi:hypothetical protein
MDSNQVLYFTNLFGVDSVDGICIETTSIMFEHQEPPPQMEEEVEVIVKKTIMGWQLQHGRRQYVNIVVD